MTPDFLITGHLPKDRFERLQTWMGLDRESEWFTIPMSGVSMRTDGAELKAMPQTVSAASRASEIRVRTVLHVGQPDVRVRIEAVLAEGGSVILRDAFGVERLQLLAGSPRLHADLSPGRYSLDANLPSHSTFDLTLLEPQSAPLSACIRAG